MSVVIDPSVDVKCHFRPHEEELDGDAALELLRGVLDDRVKLLQLPHFVDEVAAVLTRELPETAEASLDDLLDLDMRLVGSEAICATALSLSIRLRHPLFDTLY